jgi:threonine synthase
MNNSLREELRKQWVGDTVFTRSRNLEKILNIEKLFLKFEGGNPTGTMKDRAAYACLRNASKNGFEHGVIASCGNFGASFVYFSKRLGIEPHIYIPEKYTSPRIQEIKDMRGTLHRVKGSYEDAVEISSRYAAEKDWYNGNPGTPENTEASIEAYSIIAYEIFEDLGYAPDAVSVPTGNGTTLVGIFHGWKKLLEEGLTEKVPSMVAASTDGGNPIIKSYRMGERKIVELDPTKINETEYNEPLVNWKSMDGQIALDAVNESKGSAVYISDEEMLEYSKLLLKVEGLSVLPASVSSLVALRKSVKDAENKDLVAFLTARQFV